MSVLLISADVKTILKKTRTMLGRVTLQHESQVGETGVWLGRNWTHRVWGHELMAVFIHIHVVTIKLWAEGGEREREQWENRQRYYRWDSGDFQSMTGDTNSRTQQPNDLLTDLDALVHVSNYSSLETHIIRPCQSLCNSSFQFAHSLTLWVWVNTHLPNEIPLVSWCDQVTTERYEKHWKQMWTLQMTLITSLLVKLKLKTMLP